MSAVPVVAGRRRPGLAYSHPEPARFWIAYAPRAWPAGGAPWTDLGGARLQSLRAASGSGKTAELARLDAADLDDLFYLPPVTAELAAARDRWAAGLIESGTPVLIQLEPGVASEIHEALVVYDLLRPLLEGDVESLSALPAGSNTVWPLIPGFTDLPELWQRGCAALARAEVSCVQPSVVELTADQRRWLAEKGGDDVFEVLFHGAPPPERDFARCAAGHGLSVFVPRPAAGSTARQVRNRRLAAALALAGDLWLRLGRSVAAGQALLLAARRADGTRRDLAALAREGNLGVLDWLDGRGVEMVAENVAVGRSSLLESLLEEYLAATATEPGMLS